MGFPTVVLGSLCGNCICETAVLNEPFDSGSHSTNEAVTGLTSVRGNPSPKQTAAAQLQTTERNVPRRGIQPSASLNGGRFTTALLYGETMVGWWLSTARDNGDSSAVRVRPPCPTYCAEMAGVECRSHPTC